MKGIWWKWEANYAPGFESEVGRLYWEGQSENGTDIILGKTDPILQVRSCILHHSLQIVLVKSSLRRTFW